MSSRSFSSSALIHLPHVESTNDFLSRLLAKSDPKPGTAITADFQDSGRGRFGKKWHSESGKNLLLSVFLIPDFLRVSEVFFLNMLLSVSICSCLQKKLPGLSDQISVKWPNDILVDGKKICGLLIQNGFSSDRIQSTIAGIGLNVNQLHFDDFPDGLQPTSMTLLAGKNFDRRNLLKEIVSDLWQNLEDSRKNREFIRNQYLGLLQNNRGDLRIQNRAESKLIICGEVVDIQDSGRALVDDGQFKRWISIDDWKMLVS